MKKAKIYIPIVLLLSFVVVAYWPLSTFQNCMKFDIMDQYFQYRYFLSDNLANGIWPLWLPWQYYGFPYFADPQSAAWYSPTWIIAAIRPYDLYSLYFEWLAHLFIGGLGMYYLLRKLHISLLSALSVALLFECNGVFLGNAQHLTYVISMAWLPWVFLSFYQIRTRPQLKWSISGALALHFLLTGGYPAFFFIVLYALAAIFAFRLIKLLSNAQISKAIQLSKHILLSGSIFLLLSAGYLYSIFEVQGLMSRGDALQMDDILFGPYPPKAILSSILPMTVTGHPGYWGADISMIQGFIGLLPFLFLPLAFMHNHYRRAKIAIALAGVFSLLAAFGDATPLREWLSHLPLLDRFRFPSIFRAFWMGSVLILGAWGLDALRQMPKKLQWQGIGLSLLALAAILLIYGRWLPTTTSEIGSFPWRALFFASEELRSYIDQGTPYEKFFTGLSLLFSLIILYLTALFTRPGIRPWALLAVAALEGFFAVQLTHTMTITHPRPAAEYQAALREMPKNYPVPDLTPLHEHRPADPRFLPSWYNNNVFTKTVSPIGLNPFKLRTMNKMEKRDCYQRALSSPVAFFTVQSQTRPTFRFQKWQPGLISLDLDLPHSDTLVIQQSLYPGWTATVDGSTAAIHPWCGHLISLPLSSGSHHVEIQFHRRDIVSLWIYQALITFGLLLWALLLVIRGRKEMFS